MSDDHDSKKPGSGSEDDERLQKELEAISKELGLDADDADDLVDGSPAATGLSEESPVSEELEAAAERLGVEVDILREVSPEELRYILDLCPFLQVVDTVLHYIDEPPPDVQFIQAQSGWKIFDYGDAMCSSPGEHILGLYDSSKRNKKEGDGEGGDGTIWYQAISTAAEMVAMARARGWKGLQIVDGHCIMKRSAWIKALEEGLPVAGFEPSEADKKVRARVSMSQSEYETLRYHAR